MFRNVSLTVADGNMPEFGLQPWVRERLSKPGTSVPVAPRHPISRPCRVKSPAELYCAFPALAPMDWAATPYDTLSPLSSPVGIATLLEATADVTDAQSGVAMERPVFKPAGTPVEELDTPALVVDIDALDHNIETLHGFFRGVDAKVRPHVEAHRCPAIAHRQMAAGGTAGGISVTTP